MKLPEKILLLITILIIVIFYSCGDEKPEYKDSDESLSYFWKNCYSGTTAFYVEGKEVVISADLSYRWQNKEVFIKYDAKTYTFQLESDGWASVVTSSKDGGTVVCYEPIPEAEILIIKKIYEYF